ncbi:MAG: FtsW/RodA/SpoVE family cell cycle protein [Candidatus Pacebacteria bacterium]|nr:FtsW/RodA/SpoVE family cell cycle protein [Candidatus Paceibacterota bacterium]
MKRRIKKHGFDKKFLWVTFILLGVGLITFISTSLGIYTENKAQFYAMMIRHVGFGVVGGIGVMFAISHIHYSFWKKMAPYIFIAGIIITLLVFTPLGFSHGGARRWISLGFISFQPAELLKFAVIVFLSAWFAHYKDKITTWKYGLLPFLGFLGLAFVTLIKQPDSGTIALIGIVAFIIYWLRGASWKHIFAVIAIGTIFIGTYIAINPYIIERLKTFADPNRDPFGSSYQIRQSRIAIGAGQLYGRGLGQSVHKFGPYLPESNSDSIFAIFAEEYGFIGGFILITLYGIFTFFGFKIARHAPSEFAQNLVVGIILLIVIQVFFNIAAISGLVPLSGLPLIFMSNGGTALLVTLAQLGIVLNISKYTLTRNVQKKRV